MINKKLTTFGACIEARNWAKNKSWQEIYETCHRGDWLLWLFKKTNPDDLDKITLAKGKCANTVRHRMKDSRSIAAVDAAIAFGNGEIDRQQLDDAANVAANVAAAANIAAAYAYAANVAAYAAGAAYAAAYATAYAADAAANAAAAAGAANISAAYAYAARKQNQQLTADICRECLPIQIWNIEDEL